MTNEERQRAAFESEMNRIGQPLYKTVTNGVVEYGSEGARVGWIAWQTRGVWELQNPKVSIERRLLNLPMSLFNEAAKPPYQHLLAMTGFGNMLFTAFQEAGLEPLFRAAVSECPIPFSGIEINVAASSSEPEDWGTQ